MVQKCEGYNLLGKQFENIKNRRTNEPIPMEYAWDGKGRIICNDQEMKTK